MIILGRGVQDARPFFGIASILYKPLYEDGMLTKRMRPLFRALDSMARLAAVLSPFLCRTFPLKGITDADDIIGAEAGSGPLDAGVGANVFASVY